MLEDTPCCGVSIYDGLVDAEAVLLDIGSDKYGAWSDSEQAFIIFTDTKESGAGDKLAKFIEKNKLGTIISTKYRQNPNTSNLIKVWVWAPNEKNFKSWYKKNSDDEDNEDDY